MKITKNPNSIPIFLQLFYDDQELRSECIEAGLKPGPVNHQTRSGWAKRLLSKRMKEARPPKSEEPKEITAEFSADEEAINGEVAEVNEEVVESTENVERKEEEVEIVGDAEFSDDDAPVEKPEKSEEPAVEEAEEKVEENSENKVADESMVVNTSRTADTSSMEVEATISGENNKESEEKQAEDDKPAETSSKEPENANCDDCKIMTCLKSKYDTCCTYFEENKQEIFEMVVVLLIAYLLFKYKSEINDTFDRVNETVEGALKSVKEKAVTFYKNGFPKSSEEPEVEAVVDTPVDAE